MKSVVLDPPITLEITISESLLRRLQQALDAYPHQSLDTFASNALAAYLLLLRCP
jgi:hypothetical protein